jgi:hypothetical protein
MTSATFVFIIVAPLCHLTATRQTGGNLRANDPLGSHTGLPRRCAENRTMMIILDNNKTTVTFHDDGHLMHVDKNCSLMRISLEAWPNLERAKKALAAGTVKWDKWNP